MRVQSVALEHHGDVPILGVDIINNSFVNRDLARRYILQAGQHPEECRFTAARWANQDNKLAIQNLEVHALDNGCGSK